MTVDCSDQISKGFISADIFIIAFVLEYRFMVVIGYDLIVCV